MRNYITRIREIAKEKGLTLDDIAASMSLSKTGYIKAVKNSTLRVEHVMDFCVVYNIRLEELFEFELAEVKTKTTVEESQLLSTRILIKAITENSQDMAINSELILGMTRELAAIKKEIVELNEKIPTSKK